MPRRKSSAEPARAAATDGLEGVELENERLKEKLRVMEEQLNEVTEERDRLQHENNQYEMDMERRHEITRAQRDALAHGRTVIESVEGPEAFARTMNERAIDAITELLGDR